MCLIVVIVSPEKLHEVGRLLARSKCLDEMFEQSGDTKSRAIGGTHEVAMLCMEHAHLHTPFSCDGRKCAVVVNWFEVKAEKTFEG